MNDPALDDPILEASSQVKNTYKSQDKSKGKDAGETTSEDKGGDGSGTPRSLRSSESNVEDYQSPAYTQHLDRSHDESYTMPTKWWYASTGFPLITGTLGPMASAFNLCALVENWRVEIPPGGTESAGIDIPDPRWLIAVNAVSFVSAVIANMALLLNMTRRLSFSIAQPVTILGFWVSSLLLIALVAYAAHDFHAPGVQNQALTQAFYYANWAAGLYQIISILMCVTVYGAITKKYDSEFKLTMAQRTLMLQTISFLVYLLLGALVFSKIEGWKFLDALYWADFTLLTVGIGDFAPSTHLGRGLLFPFAIGGIVILGLVVSSIRSLVLDRGKKKMSARMTENIRKRVVREIETFHNKQQARKKHPPRLDKDLINELSSDPQDDPMDEIKRRKAEFDAMRKVQQLSDRRQKWMNLTVSTTSFALLWFVGAVVFWQTEIHPQGWTYFMSLYFSYTSLLTIGYGDLSPVSNSGKPFFVIWSLLAVPSLTILISDMGDTVVAGIKDLTIWLGEITILPSDQGSVVERLEYGLSKATGNIGSKRKNEKDDESDSDGAGSDSHELPPGLVRLFKSSKKRNKNAEKTTDRIAANFEKSEQQDEDDAHDRGDKTAEDDHHYRHLLLSQVRRVYADSNESQPKKYSYKEWAFFLKLLGEDESSSKFHRLAHAKQHKKSGKQGTDDDSSEEQEEQQDLQKWSWIGQRSPLMSDKDEPSILLEMLFSRLEESLQNINKHKEQPIKQEAGESTPLPDRQVEESAASSET